MVIDGVSGPIETLKDTMGSITDESWPGTATVTLPEWHVALGVEYDPLVRTIEEQRRMLEAMETTTGGVTISALQIQFDKEFFGRVVVSELSTTGVTGVARTGVARTGTDEPRIYEKGYNVIGGIYNDLEASRVASIVARYGPAHLTPNYILTNTSHMTTGITGQALCGLSRTGYSL